MLKVRIFSFFSLLAFSLSSFAKTSKDLGAIANAINEPITAIMKLIHIVCLVAGIALIVGALIRYKQHRNNPVEVPLSSCITMLIVGAALVALTFVPMPI